MQKLITRDEIMKLNEKLAKLKRGEIMMIRRPRSEVSYYQQTLPTILSIVIIDSTEIDEETHKKLLWIKDQKHVDMFFLFRYGCNMSSKLKFTSTYSALGFLDYSHNVNTAEAIVNIFNYLNELRKSGFYKYSAVSIITDLQEADMGFLDLSLVKAFKKDLTILIEASRVISTTRELDVEERQSIVEETFLENKWENFYTLPKWGEKLFGKLLSRSSKWEESVNREIIGSLAKKSLLSHSITFCWDTISNRLLASKDEDIKYFASTFNSEDFSDGKVFLGTLPSEFGLKEEGYMDILVLGGVNNANKSKPKGV